MQESKDFKRFLKDNRKPIETIKKKESEMNEILKEFNQMKNKKLAEVEEIENPVNIIFNDIIKKIITTGASQIKIEPYVKDFIDTFYLSFLQKDTYFTFSKAFDLAIAEALELEKIDDTKKNNFKTKFRQFISLKKEHEELLEKKKRYY